MVPLKGIYSEMHSALDYMKSSVVMNEYIQSVQQRITDFIILALKSECHTNSG